MATRTILQFVCYEPRLYSGMDRFLVRFCQEAVKKGIQPVMIYCNTVENCEPLRKDLEESGASIEFIPYTGIFRQAITIIRLLVRYRPMIVHSHFINNVKWLLAIFRPLFGFRYFINFHSTIYIGGVEKYHQENGLIKTWLFRSIFCGWLHKSAESVVCVSRELMLQWQSFVGPTKSTVLYLGVPCENSNRKHQRDIRTLQGFPLDKILLVSVGAIEHIKGIDVLMGALRILKTQGYTEAKFYHIGDVRSDTKERLEYKKKLQQLPISYGLQDCVSWLGKRSDVMDLLPAFDIYVHPSRYEGIGVALMEAAHAGLPLIGSRVGGIPEVVLDGQNGLLFESENSQELAQKIKLLVDNEELRGRFSKESPRIALERFSIGAQVQKLIELYRIS